MDNETIGEFLMKGQVKEHFLISDIAKHGCSGGVSGITTYNETCDFYDKHKNAIWDMLYDLKEEEGFTIPFLMSDFDGAKQVHSEDTFKNFLVWWAVTNKAVEYQKN